MVGVDWFNKVIANFKFKDGLIIDTFDLWTWTQKEMGLTGYLMGWSFFMKAKIQQETKKNR